MLERRSPGGAVAAFRSETVKRRSTGCEHGPATRRKLRACIDTDLPVGELERLAHVDALLRAAAARARDRGPATVHACDVGVNRSHNHAQELRLSFRELALIHKSLRAVKTLGALPPQDELLNDTIQLVDQALARARQLP
jgi:imidazolonepropionase-like amidohydrolase